MAKNTYVALLRGINVGGNAKVEMKKLKVVFEKLGYLNVRTYINSGNVIFETTKKESGLVPEIERELHKNFKFPIKVLIRDYKNISKICKKVDPKMVNGNGQKTDVIFLWEKYNDKSSLKLLKLNPLVDNVMYIDGAIVWNILFKDYNKSGMHKFIGTELYKHMTGRNINTVRKLKELME